MNYAFCLTHSRSRGNVKPVDTPSEALLRAAGLRVTRPRAAVLEVLSDHPHASADLLVREVRTRLSSVSTQAVYDVLAAFVTAGIVRRIKPAGLPALFERRTGDNHHHLVCRTCGQVTDVDCAVRQRPCLSPSDDAGYLLEEAEVTFWGRCPTCRAEPAMAGR